jgi:PAS domain S-box-containing protein
VLIVEDNADMNAFIAETLRPYYRVISAFDGRTGLNKALALVPDLILADVMMPVMSGDAMALELRARPEMAGVPIIMLTAKADDELRVKLLEAGVQDYLAKPFVVAELLARVGGLLADRQRTSAQLRASETRFEATFEQASVGIALVAPDGRFLRVNSKFCEILGRDSAALLSLNFKDISHPDDFPVDRENLQRLVAGDIPSFTREKRYLHQGGEITWGRVSVSLIRKSGGAPDYFVAVLENIQVRRQTELELHRRNEELERFDSATVGREMAMIKLKQQVNALSAELGRTPPFPLDFIEKSGEGIP